MNQNLTASKVFSRGPPVPSLIEILTKHSDKFPIMRSFMNVV